MATPSITFVHAPVSEDDHFDSALFAPLWAYTLAAYVPAPWTARVADCLLVDPATIARTDVFAFSGTNQDFDSIRRVHALLRAKYPQATFVLGGPITWSLQQEGKLELVDFFDHVFVLDGEETLPAFLRSHHEGMGAAALPKVIQGERFALEKARPVAFDLAIPGLRDYYGAAIEVSRGCPFLCEFCDVRVLPDNNRANNKDVDLVIGEVDRYFAAGVTQLLFVCDNFIGDVAWARRCVDALEKWRKRIGPEAARLSIFTWATINLVKFPDLMRAMRRAGFSVLYIGIESVNDDALLETAKVQNRVALEPAVRAIQACGFIIAPGFIFGFDSDRDDVFDATREFIVRTGLIGGDPAFLTAMPGTPLFARMQQSGRLVERAGGAAARRKISTNVRYLLDRGFLARGFVQFIEQVTGAETQWQRFRTHIESLVASEAFVAPDGPAALPASSALGLFRGLLQRRPGRRLMARRAAYLLEHPARLAAVARGWWLVQKASRRGRDARLHFYFWVYAWTSMGLRYRGLREEDVALSSVESGFDLARLVEPEAGDADVAVESLARRSKAALQARHTRRALRRLVASRTPEGAAAPATPTGGNEAADDDGGRAR